MTGDRAQRLSAPGPERNGGESVFISDLHLAADRPNAVDLFLGFLGGRARSAEKLFILGDLFDSWIGDDDDTPMHRTLIDALSSLSQAGVACRLMHGNRDFLIGRRFARAAGCTLLRDPERILLDGERVLLMHGDLLCTDDVAYQRFRRKVRNPLVQRLFLWKSLAARRQIAAKYRAKSGEAMATKTAEIMDANQQEVIRRMRHAKAQRLVHGHTHRPADHQLLVDGVDAKRHVLADWSEERGEVLVHAGGQWQRELIG
jgi:UDP-2,3-diacylglucosamine hydrolase